MPVDCIIMHQHQHQHQHQHGPHGHQGHGAMPMLGFVQDNRSPDEYFRSLWKKWEVKDDRALFWSEVLQGKALDKAYEKVGLEFMRCLSCQMPMMILLTIENMVNFECVPRRLQHITAGLFFPLLFLLFFNYNVVVGVAATDSTLYILGLTTCLLYLAVGLRGSSRLGGQSVQQRSKAICEVRPYLKNPQMSCQACGIVKLFRSAHCPFCKCCMAKQSRHSSVFGICIGAANELLALLFFLALSATLVLTLIYFSVNTHYGMITNIMFYLVNGPLFWLAAGQALQLLVLNLIYGITQQELKTWPMLQYLLKMPERTYQNSVNQGFLLNLQGSLMAFLGIKGYESENGWGTAQLMFPQVDPNRTYRLNWDKAAIYVVPQLPFHPNRVLITQMMMRDEPKMIEMAHLQMRFREEVLNEEHGHFNELQLQQKVAMKMQAHMMRNMQQQVATPATEQQRNILLNVLGRLKDEVKGDALESQISELEARVRDGNVNSMQAGMQMRMIQQQIMVRRMAKAMQQQMEEKKKQEEQAPMRSHSQQSIYD